MTEILNTYEVGPLITTSGQPTADQFSGIAAQGFRAVINLAMPDSDGALADEGAIVAALGMNYIHIPVPFEAPSATHLRRFLGILAAFDGDKLWVHCAVNARVSAFMYHYLHQVKGMPEDQCRSPLLERWLPDMNPVWREFMAIDLSPGQST